MKVFARWTTVPKLDFLVTQLQSENAFCLSSFETGIRAITIARHGFPCAMIQFLLSLIDFRHFPFKIHQYVVLRAKLGMNEATAI